MTVPDISREEQLEALLMPLRTAEDAGIRRFADECKNNFIGGKNHETGQPDDAYLNTPEQQDMILALMRETDARHARKKSERGGDIATPQPFIAVMGPPGNGKSTHTTNFLCQMLGLRFDAKAWADPAQSFIMTRIVEAFDGELATVDRRFLPPLNAMMAQKEGRTIPYDVHFYLKARYATLALSGYSMGMAFQRELMIVNDATYGSPYALANLRLAQSQKRPTFAEMVVTDNDSRIEGIERRAQNGFVQSIGAVTEKQRAQFEANIPDLVGDTDKGQGFDETAIYYRAFWNAPPVLAARIGRSNDGERTYTIAKPEAFASVCEIYPCLPEVVRKMKETPNTPTTLPQTFTATHAKPRAKGVSLG